MTTVENKIIEGTFRVVTAQGFEGAQFITNKTMCGVWCDVIRYDNGEAISTKNIAIADLKKLLKNGYKLLSEDIYSAYITNSPCVGKGRPVKFVIPQEHKDFLAEVEKSKDDKAKKDKEMDTMTILVKDGKFSCKDKDIEDLLNFRLRMFERNNKGNYNQKEMWQSIFREYPKVAKTYFSKFYPFS